MNDDVLVVAISPDAKYIAVALLDCTVKVSWPTFMMWSGSYLLLLSFWFMVSKKVT